MAPSLFPQDAITLGLRGWPQRAELVRETVTSALNLPTQTTPYISGLLQALTLITSPPRALCAPAASLRIIPPAGEQRGKPQGRTRPPSRWQRLLQTQFPPCVLPAPTHPKMIKLGQGDAATSLKPRDLGNVAQSHKRRLLGTVGEPWQHQTEPDPL